jgi:hypothetical protein
MPDTWRDRWPRGVLDPHCPEGHAIDTSTDRLLLWHIELVVGGGPVGIEQRQLAADLRRYLNDTCEHHWHGYTPDPDNENDVPAHRQCLWCNTVEWREPADGEA